MLANEKIEQFKVLKMTHNDEVFLAVRNLTDTLIFCYIESAGDYLFQEVDFPVWPKAISRYYPEPDSEYQLGCF